tara:strand:+ start:441 stop:851 length:411 start_codon:yes stop_codon:yes gene_type:complete
MSSQLNVDTIVDKAGSGGTNVKIANTSTYVGDGGSGTQNTVQSLVKCWFLDSEGGSSLDSFNVSSNTDNDTGDYTKGFTNNFSSDNFSPPASCGQNTSFFVINKARATSSVTQFNVLHNNTSTDGRQVCVVCGDLA